MKKMIGAWIFIAVCLFGTLLFIGISYNKEYKPYRDLEADMQESASLYILTNQIKLNIGEKVKIVADDLDSLESMKVKDDTCDGYVIAKKTLDDMEYEAFIKCKNYTTVDYDA